MVDSEFKSVSAANLQGSPDYIAVSISRLKAGARVEQPLYDARDGHQQLLLAAGKQLVPAHLENLAARGIEFVMIHRSDWERFDLPEAKTSRGRSSRSLPAANPRESIPAAPSWNGWKCEADSFLHQLRTPAQPARDAFRIQQFQASYNARVSTVRGLIEGLLSSKKLHLDAAYDVCQGQLLEITEDIDEFLMRGTLPVLADYPSRHSLQTAMLATAMAIHMGHNQQDLLELGIGCLIHDVGMLMVPAELLQATTPITPANRLELQKHPIHAANMLQECRDFPQKSRHIVYQMHERMDGSGYPRGRVGTQIHPLARIAAVADTYLSLVSPRPFREALLPYQAIERILLSTRKGLFDPAAVRALLHTLSLFPIGSYVQLTDGRVAKVIRSHDKEFGSPTVEIIEPLAGGRTTVIDLRNEPKLAVKVSIRPPETQAPARRPPSESLLVAAANL